MPKCRYQHYTQQQCNRIDQLRKQGLPWRIISERMGISDSTCRALQARAQ